MCTKNCPCAAEGEDSGSEGGEGAEGSEGAEEEDLSELQQEIADLDEGEEGPNEVLGAAVGGANLGEEEEGSDDEIEDRK